MRLGLVVPVAVSKVIFFGNVFVSLASFGLVLCGVVFVGRKRRWKTGRTLFVIFLLTFASVMIYSIIVEAPKAYASQTDAQLQQEKVYYFYEDHIGKPILMSEYEDYDGDGNLYFRKTYDAYCQPAESTSEIWRTNFEPFGVDDYSFNSAGIDVGAGEDCHSTLEGWLPPFRFPGQYADPELLEDFVYNHWRFYMPEIGRYTGPEPLGIVKDNLYAYFKNNPVIFTDIHGLFGSPMGGSFSTPWPGTPGYRNGCHSTSLCAANILNISYSSADKMVDSLGAPYNDISRAYFRDAALHCMGSCLAYSNMPFLAPIGLWEHEWLGLGGNVIPALIAEEDNHLKFSWYTQSPDTYYQDVFNNAMGKSCSIRDGYLDISVKTCYDKCFNLLINKKLLIFPGGWAP